MNDYLPSFCSPLDSHWLLPSMLPGVQLRSTRFDPTRLQPEDFTHTGIQPPPNIQRSVVKRQAEFLAGRLCARAALTGLNGQPSVPAIGKDRAPVWPNGISGSITHGDQWAAALVAEQQYWRALGLDVESQLDAERAVRLHEPILTPTERTRFASDLSERPGLLVTLVFSFKESLFKALYPLVRKSFYFEDAELLEWDTTGHAQLRLLTDLSSEWRQGSKLYGQFACFDGRLLSLVAAAA